MLDLILTVLFGWAGYWKFKNGKIALGIVWLITFGAFGFGWLFDIIFALVACLNNTKATTKQPAAPVNALPPKPAQAQAAAPRPIAQTTTAQRPSAPVPIPAPVPASAPLPVSQPAAAPVKDLPPKPAQVQAVTPRPVQQQPTTIASPSAPRPVVQSKTVQRPAAPVPTPVPRPIAQPVTAQRPAPQPAQQRPAASTQTPNMELLRGLEETAKILPDPDGSLSSHLRILRTTYEAQQPAAPVPQLVQQWKKWDTVHSEPDQQKRIASAKKAENTPLSLDKGTAVATFSGSHGVYYTTLETCKCADFSKRNKPCKHIYRLAIECGLIDAGVFYSDVKAIKTPDDDAPVVELSRVDIGKPIGSLGCYLTYTPDVLEPPTVKQLAYLKDLGVLVPSGVTKQDASCMISRATGEDSEEGPSAELVALAMALGVKFSAFIGAENLLYYVVNSTSGKDRAALYAYAVQQSLAGQSFGNMLTDPARDQFYAFADFVTADASLVKSLDGREPSDFIKPQRGTKIYKAAAEFLEGGTQ